MDLNNATVPAELFGEGLWVPAPEFGPDVAWRVRDLEVPEYQALYEKLVSDLPLEKRLPVLDIAEAERIQNICVARVLLTGWKGWTDGDKPLPFTVDRALEFMTDPKFVRLRRSIRSAVNTVEMRGRTSEALEGNVSAPPSPGS